MEPRQPALAPLLPLAQRLLPAALAVQGLLVRAHQVRPLLAVALPEPRPAPAERPVVVAPAVGAARLWGLAAA